MGIRKFKVRLCMDQASVLNVDELFIYVGCLEFTFALGLVWTHSTCISVT
jgi:hypothetical protein